MDKGAHYFRWRDINSPKRSVRPHIWLVRVPTVRRSLWWIPVLPPHVYHAGINNNWPSNNQTNFEHSGCEQRDKERKNSSRFIITCHPHTCERLRLYSPRSNSNTMTAQDMFKNGSGIAAPIMGVGNVMSYFDVRFTSGDISLGRVWGNKNTIAVKSSS